MRFLLELQTNQPLLLTNAQIINYFVSRNSVDSMPANDMKAIDSSALNLFQCGHVQDIKCALINNWPCFDIVSAWCGCPAWKGPHASCKHMAVLRCALKNFCRLKNIPVSYMYIRTNKLQEWNRPGSEKLNIIPVADLSLRWMTTSTHL